MEPNPRCAVLPVAGDHVEFRDPDLVRQPDLPNRLFVCFGRSGPVDSINERQHARYAIEPVQRRFRQESLKNRAGLGEPRRLDNYIVKGRDLAGLSGVVERIERTD